MMMRDYGMVVVGTVFCVAMSMSSSGDGKHGRDPKQEVYTLIDNGVQIDLGRVWSTSGDREFSVPFKAIGMRAEEVASVKTPCGCVVPREVEPGDETLEVRYNPTGRHGEVHQEILLMHKDTEQPPRRVVLRGEVIPGWYATPNAVRIGQLQPEQEVPIDLVLRIEYAPDDVNLQSMELVPRDEAISLASRSGEDARSITVTGVVRGDVRGREYRGKVVITVGKATPQVIEIPVEVTHVGIFSSYPKSLTFSGTSAKAQTIRFAHWKGGPVEIDHVECPGYLTAEVVGTDRVVVRRNHSSDQASPVSITCDVMRAFFKQPTECGVAEVPVLFVP